MNRVGLIVFGDFVAFWLSFMVILFLRFGPLAYQHAISTHLVPFAILYLTWVLSFFLFGLYDLFTIKPTIPHLNRFAWALSVCFIIGIFLFYFVSIFGITPKTNLLFQLLGFGIISFSVRRIIYVIFSETITRPVILIGSSKDISEIDNVISNHPQLGLKTIDHVENFKEAIKKYEFIHNAVFIFKNISEKIPNESIVNLYRKNTEIINVAQAYEEYLHKIPVGYIDQTWIIENINIKENFLYKVTKKILDVVFSISLLIVTSPLVLISSIFIYFYDHGPIIYKQKRVGLNGKEFEIYKLRSMIINSGKSTIAHSTPVNDPRITPVGKVIRKLHIDEIPQMINILKGDMTLVGPRPECREFSDPFKQSIPHYEIRQIIRPGFTGWAQIKYRHTATIEDTKEKFEYDLYYIKNKNIFIDLGIILRTMQIIFTH